VPERAKRLEEARSFLTSSENGYRDRAVTINLHTIKPTENVRGLLSRDEMVLLYEGNFSRTKTNGRAIYDALRATAINGICPLCGVQRASTLDHHLAKSEHPTFAITPINLVPSCSDCNHSKSAHQPSTSEEEAVHPYYDDIDDARWLFAYVVEEQPVSLIFFANPPSSWITTKRARVLRHFKTLNLARLYTSQSSDDLPSMRFRLERLLSASGPEAVRQQLLEERDDRLKDVNNSWQIAMLDALSSSYWYCAGGFVIT
jgi:5-methylcytosine-specific restriction endonuclease McrA